MKNKIFIACISLALLTGCNSFLDQEPLSQLSPEQYLSTEENLAAYATDLYNTLPVHETGSWGRWLDDNNTDNMAYVNPSDIFALK